MTDEQNKESSNLSSPFGGQGASSTGAQGAVTIYYCYDAYCGWCYGFSKVITQIAEEYKDQFFFEVLSGGMIMPEQPTHFASLAKYIQGAYTQVEELTGVKFGEDFL